MTYPLPTSNNPDIIQVRRYFGVAGWADVDPVLAKMALTDHVESLRAMSGPLWRGGGSALFSANDFGSEAVATNWRDDPVVQAYCTAHGYAPPPAASTTTPAK